MKIGQLLAGVWVALKELVGGILSALSIHPAPSVSKTTGGLLKPLASMTPLHAAIVLIGVAVVGYLAAGVIGKLLGAFGRLAVLAAVAVAAYLLFVH